MDLKTMSVDELQARKSEIAAEVDSLEDIETVQARNAELDEINAELEARKKLAEAKAEIREAVASGEGEVVEKIEFKEEERKEMFGIETIEYRDAWIKNVFKLDMSTEERNALTAAANVIPKITVNDIWDKLVKKAELLGKVDVLQFQTYVRFPVVTTNNPAAGQAVSTAITESSDVIGYVDLIPNEYVKSLKLGADIEHMAIQALHDWVVDNLASNIYYAINKDIVVGSGTNALKGIKESVNASATAIPATVTKASILGIMAALPGNYQQGAIWIMTPKMFFEDIMSITALNDYVINDGFQYRLFGHDVVLMSECEISSKETIFYGDPKAYKVNIFNPIEVKPFETGDTTMVTYRGACLADGELLDTSAFVRFAQT